MSFKFLKEGFTLIELLIVISIIGVLATIGVISFSGAQERARDANRKSDLRNIQTAIEVFKNDLGFAPLDSTGLIAGCGTVTTSGTGTECAWGGTFAANGITYMNTLPTDPRFDTTNHPTYLYYYERDGSFTDLYTLTACLENAQDEDCNGDEVGEAYCTSVGGGCAYQVRP